MRSSLWGRKHQGKALRSVEHLRNDRSRAGITGADRNEISGAQSLRAILLREPPLNAKHIGRVKSIGLHIRRPNDRDAVVAVGMCSRLGNPDIYACTHPLVCNDAPMLRHIAEPIDAGWLE